MVFITVPLAVRSLSTQDAATFLVLLSVGRVVAGLDFGVAQLVTPRFIRDEQPGEDRRLQFCVSSLAVLLGVTILVSFSLAFVFQVVESQLVGHDLFSNFIQVFALGFGLSLTTFSREIAVATGTVSSALLASAPLSMGFLAVAVLVGITDKVFLIVILSGYLGIQSVAIIAVAVQSKKYIGLRSVPHSDVAEQVDTDWRIAGQMQLISLGNLAAVQAPISIAALHLLPAEVVLVGVAFQVAGATRLLGGSLAPFLTARLARMPTSEVARKISSARKVWWCALVAGAVVGLVSARFIAGRVFESGRTGANLWMGVAWGFVWAAVALVPLLTTTALRSRLRLQFELRLASITILGAAVLSAAVWWSKSSAVLLCGSLTLALAVSLSAEINGKRHLCLRP